MAGKTSGCLLLEESNSVLPGAVVASKSARNSRCRQGSECGRTGARSNSKSKSNNDDDDTTNTASYYCGQPGSACKSPASEPTNNGSSRAGNNSNRVGSASGNRSSYSKIFRQYLPSSLNLNYTLSSSSCGIKTSKRFGAEARANVDEEEQREGKEVEEEEKEELREKDKKQRQRVITLQQVEAGQSNQLVAKSIASALSRFRISSNSVKDKQASDSLLDLDWTLDQSKNSLKTTDSSIETTPPHTFKTKQRRTSIEQVHDINNNSYSEELLGSQAKVQFDLCETGDRKNELLKEERVDNRETFEKEQRVKRKGFLYLKKINKKGENIKQVAGELSNQKNQIAAEEQGKRRRAHSSGNNSKKFNPRDPNNNSISSLLSSPSNGRHVDDHTTCLLDEQEEEEEEDVGQMFGCVEKSRQKVEFERILGTEQSKGAKKMSTKSSSSSSKLKPSRTAKHSGHLLAAGSLLVALLIGLTALLTSAVLAQQQLPSGSFRSQPSLQGGPQSQQSSGGQQSSSLVGAQPPLGGGGSNRSPASQSAASPPQPVAGSLVANINCNKIRGHVTLTPNLRGGTTVTTQISAGPPGEVYQWSVHQFPVKPGAAMCSCSALILGTKLIDLSEMHGNLPSDQEFNVQSSLNLFGADSPVGHSLMLRGMKTGMVACATFLPTR